MPKSQFTGNLAIPRSGNGTGVLVLHAWWGLSEAVRSTCSRLAEEGFAAYAPDLYHGKLAATIEEAEVLSSQLDAPSAEADIAEAVNLLWERVQPASRGIGVVGFSLGAYFALKLSNDDPRRVRAVTLFYGTGSRNFDRSRASYLGHFAEKDPYEPAEEVEALESALRSAGRTVHFYHYEGTGHWFFENDQPEAYKAEAARLAWERTVDFLKTTLLT